MKSVQPIESFIVDLRGRRVMLDADLAVLYQVPTKRLNEAVKRNAGRFPADFAFRLTPGEWSGLKSQSAASSGTHGGRRKLPLAFTEHGALMAANVLRSERAVQMSVFVVRAFVSVRERLAANAVILKRLAEIDRTLLQHGSALQAIWAELQPLLEPPPEPPRPRIGFNP